MVRIPVFLRKFLCGNDGLYLWRTFCVLVLSTMVLPLEGKGNSDMFLRDQIATAEVTFQSTAVGSTKFDQGESSGKGSLKRVSTNFYLNKTTSTTESNALILDDSQIYATSTSNENLTSPAPTPYKHISEEYSSLPEPSSTTSTSIDIFSTNGTSATTSPPTYPVLPSPDETKERSSLESSSVAPSPRLEGTMEPKSAIPTLLFLTSLGTMATSTMRTPHKYPHSSNFGISKKTTKRPLSTKKPGKPIENGLVVKNKRRRKPKPGRTTTTTTTTADPNDDDFSSSIESSEVSSTNSTSTTTTTKGPPSKLAMAMISSSSKFEFENASTVPLYYPQTPANLLNILQAYTKQLQANQTGVTKPIVQIPNTPFMLNLNQLNFAAKIGISFYYSLIAIIPLIYLAFGGISRLGLFEAITGRRRSGTAGRRRKRSISPYYLSISQNANLGQRADDDDDDDDYTWIIDRISQIILEISMMENE